MCNRNKRCKIPDITRPPRSLRTESDRKVRTAGGESAVSHSRLPRGARPRLPRGLPLCVFWAPHPPREFTAPSYSEMNRFCFFQSAITGPPGFLRGAVVLAWGPESPCLALGRWWPYLLWPGSRRRAWAGGPGGSSPSVRALSLPETASRAAAATVRS